MRTNRLHYPLLGLSLLALLAAIWVGWVRIGWLWPVWNTAVIQAHGPLMVSAFLGSLIALERAVALRQRWMYLAPLLSGLGGLILLSGLNPRLGEALILLSGLFFIGIMVVIIRVHLALYTFTMFLGVLAWEVGNLFWLIGWPVYRIVFWWISFLVLTIVAERLEMGRIIRLPGYVELLFGVAVASLLIGDIVFVFSPGSGTRLAGLGLLVISVWLLRFDIARRTVRQVGLPRYAAICLLLGYVWLGISGLLGLFQGERTAGFGYDAFLHSVLVGFVISMIFGHAPIIFPAVLHLPIKFTPVFYIHLALLHLSLGMRVAGDLIASSSLRMWGGLLNGIAILLFLTTTAYALRPTINTEIEKEGV